MEAPSPPPFTNDDSWSDLNRRDDDRRDIANNENLNLVEVEEGWSANSNSNANEAFEDEGGESAEGEGTDVLDGEGTLSLSAHYRRSFPDDSASGSAGGGGGSGALKTVHSGRSLSSSHSLQSQSPSQSQSQSQSHGSAPAAAATPASSSSTTASPDALSRRLRRRLPLLGAASLPPLPPSPRKLRATAVASASSLPTSASSSSALPPSTTASTSSLLSSNPRAALFASQLSRRTPNHSASSAGTNHSSGIGGGDYSSANNNHSSFEPEEIDRHARRVAQRYRTGDYALIMVVGHSSSRPSHSTSMAAAATSSSSSSQTHASSHYNHNTAAFLVNRHGFPPGEGDSPEEKVGPHRYVLARVRTVHFEEIAAYYTVTRCDNGMDQRADADYMEPLRTKQGEQAALRAATRGIPPTPTDGRDNPPDHHRRHPRGGGLDAINRRRPWRRCLQPLRRQCESLKTPMLRPYRAARLAYAAYARPCYRSVVQCVRRQATLMLNGLAPYRCRVRLTCVNFVVLCSVWYMFVDQARLAFFPPSSDNAIATVNLAVWAILVLELLVEVFVRPDGYRLLIKSEKAFSPTTERYISAFHLAVEFVSLIVFIPEFFCVVSPTVDCDDRMPFSFFNAALMSVVGPTRLDTFYGHAYFALIRLRIFGLVRHWKNMWIANTFIKRKWKQNKPQGWWRSIVPHRSSSAFLHHPHKLMSTPEGTRPSTSNGTSSSAATAAGTSSHEPLDPDLLEQRKRETALTNASTIGTALMVTNSYRALAILWLIVGMFPIVFCFLNTLTNSVALQMTAQMQGTNLVASDNTNETCEFLSSSMWSWVWSIQQPDFYQSYDPYLLTLDVRPIRCEFQMGLETVGAACREYDVAYAAMMAEVQSGNLDAPNATVSEDLKLVGAICSLWVRAAATSVQDLAQMVGIRQGAVLYYDLSRNAAFFNESTGTTTDEDYSVLAAFNATYTVAASSMACLLLQLCFLFMVLGGLSTLRRDAEVLVLGPLRRMLKRVARYARNPLMPPKLKRLRSPQRSPAGRTKASIEDDFTDDLDDWNSDGSSDDDDGGGGRGGSDQHGVGTPDDDLALGSYETEQLNTAVNKITDLLRKCWGVAGADIISTNLATRGGALTDVFNPTVPGKSVYALFGFVSINDFDHVLRELQDDVMILINDVAAVLHDEVFRWGFGDSGQCNKNLGSAFLMVFRIGLVKEVMEKLEQATDVVFSTKSSHASNGKRRLHNRHSSMGSHASTKSSLSTGSGQNYLASGPASATARATSNRPGGSQLRQRKDKRPTQVNPMSLSLQSLPGIATFTDRAVIGMLKSFAGIYRDNKIRNWNNDFRLGQGVGVFTVSMIFGMDAGWAVEGAVGSEHKIDATYLSPHVNMASRMMGACKQYNVTLLLSQAVQELMSDVARTKLRHLDTISVKGSSVKQKIYTYDARPKGVDFFLFERPDDQADFDAERYSPQIWNTDQDLRAMRQHVTEEFLQEFNHGRKAYLAGDWKLAIRRLERANEIMVETALEEGYLEEEFDTLQLRAGEDARAAEEELKLQNGDGPSILLLNFMRQLGGVAPKGWDGWHPLTRK